MSIIIQASNRKDLIRQEKKVRITNWKFIKPITSKRIKDVGLEFCVGYDVYFINNMSFSTFHKINHQNINTKCVFEYVRSSLICIDCSGTGLIDWIDKATPGREKTNINLNDVFNYKRNKKGVVNILLDDGGLITYTSTPVKRIGEEFCSACRGCGIALSNFYHAGTTTFDPS